MKKLILCVMICLFGVGFSLAQTLTSPDGNLVMDFHLSADKTPVYSLKYKGKDVIKESKMGFQIRPSFDFSKNFRIVETKEDASDTTWNPVWGQNSVIRDNHKELFVALEQEGTGWLLNIRFRLFDDGLGFRYEFPVQKELRHFTINEEVTEFQLVGDYKAFWIPADYDTNEFQITTSKLSEVPQLIDKARDEALACKSPSPNLAVQTPLMLKSDDGLYINIHEAALVNYPAMHLNLDAQTFLMSSHLTPDKNGTKGYIQTGSTSPWRTIIVSHDVGRPDDQGYPIRGMIRGDYLYLKNFETERWPAGNPETGYMNVDGSPTKTEVLKAKHNKETAYYWQLSFGKRKAEELYNIRKDPDCMVNLAEMPEYETLKRKLEKEMTLRLVEQEDPRMFGRGGLFDKYPDMSPAHQFWNRTEAGEKVRSGWVNPTDFQ